MNKKILLGSIIAVAILVVMSFPTAVGLTQDIYRLWKFL